MDQYRSEEEQVEALRRWWDENGRSTILAVVIALGGAFGWQSWQDYAQRQQEGASNIYTAMMQLSGGGPLSAEQLVTVKSYAEQLKSDYSSSTYAQFAALQLARSAVESGDLDAAEVELRWVLGRADKGSDVARVSELRLARVLAAKGDAEQALAILSQADEGPYAAAYAMARGDVLLSLGRDEEARQAYASARAMTGAGAEMSRGTLQQKLDSLMPGSPVAAVVDPVEADPVEAAATAAEAIAETAQEGE